MLCRIAARRLESLARFLIALAAVLGLTCTAWPALAAEIVSNVATLPVQSWSDAVLDWVATVVVGGAGTLAYALFKVHLGNIAKRNLHDAALTVLKAMAAQGAPMFLRLESQIESGLPQGTLRTIVENMRLSVPKAFKRLRPPPEVLENIIMSKIPEVKVLVAAGSTAPSKAA